MRAEKLIFVILVLAGALLLLLPALYNGYPLVNADDGTYIASGFKLETPADRPITYGLFLRVFSLNGVSFWIALVVQAICLSFLILKILQRATKPHRFWIRSLFVFIVLAGTSASWTVSQIIPDIWTSMALLSLVLLVWGKERRGTRVFLYCLYTTAVATHMSNILILSGVLVLLFLFRKYFFPPQERRRLHLTLITTFLLTWATFATMGAAYAKSKNIFMMASLVEKRILKKYLAEYCPQQHYDLCNYQDQLPDDPNVFLWDPVSPVYQAGGWQATREEYGRITGDIFTKPRYVGLFLQAAARGTWQQFFTCHLAEGNFPFPAGTDVHKQVTANAPRDRQGYENAWQHQNGSIVQQLSVLNVVHYGLVIAGLLVLAGQLLLVRRRLLPFLRLLLFLLLAGYVVNVIDCATFAQVNARFGSRLIWVLPFCSLVCMLGMLSPKRGTQKLP